MNFTLIAIAVPFAVGVAFLAMLTARRRGPFAIALARLHGGHDAYVHVATSLWVVVLGLVALPFLAWRWPDATAEWGAVAFIVLAVLANAMRSAFKRRSA